ncbi:uncharacterized protein LOC122281618 isoform X3 [Carya illinoinensis]|uniref:Uncharacterized protein n=2 Tax=Carya illinoinensis TaxID=32201 RepID=A0A8T1P1T4_CARIL|nr:uncharacterized protein LOC122281618 isoform X3 [Carya illinoinensis]XP_042949217.1 uncharacterized protein LOC122281618 isoform X3 [Carya illinoinensis]XP_042949218.1 uncharacterized protein LOC122281618 isoform X3 [Carya illinoinensis]XP_042949219.1 uncharacterized protein LOC122281618 isoform X3 [Carya illinoinensis]XP_042949221.1 uncharacterized protein LOC122281618 isoform X3 [Carya illinoinensis]XP_042949222.1 uncharacterized protein LOC122281618 isoform X3 [Carya illinoinensis]XP_04
MMDLITLFSELAATLIILVTRPCSLFKLACFFTMKTVFIVIHTWMELVRATFGFHVNLFSRTMVLTVALISLPVRILNALKRERQLELYLHDIQIELENLEWDRKELVDDLRTAIKERKRMELILAEVEEEHDKAIAKIEQLEGEFQDLKNENLRLKEIKDEVYWSIKGPDDMDNGQNTGFSESSGIPYGISSWKSSYNGSGIFLQDPMMSKDTWGDEEKPKTKFLNFLKARIQPLNPDIISRQLDMDEVLGQRREVAMSHSLFSAVLSLLVGIIIWEAEDPCMPLVVALFTVVGMSLKSVFELFSTIKIKHASDAVALLSFNWFVLGMLTYPALPRVARMLAPMSLMVVDKLVSSL